MITKEHRSKNLKIIVMFILFLLPINVKGEDKNNYYDKFKLKDGDVPGYILKREGDIVYKSVVLNNFKPSPPEIDESFPVYFSSGLGQLWEENKSNNTKATDKFSNYFGIRYYFYKTPCQALLAMNSTTYIINVTTRPTTYLIGDASLDFIDGTFFVRKNVFIEISDKTTERYKTLNSIFNTIVTRIDENFSMSPTIEEVINDIHLLQYMDLIEKESIQDLEDKLISAKDQEKEKSIETLKSFINEIETHSHKTNQLSIWDGRRKFVTDKQALELTKDKYLTTPVANGSSKRYRRIEEEIAR